MYRSGCSCKILISDFDFAEEFGYFFWKKIKTKKSNAIFYRNKKNEGLEIGYSFEKREIYVNRYAPANSPTPEPFLLIEPGSYIDKIRKYSSKKSHEYFYHTQIGEVRTILYLYLFDKMAAG